MAPQSGDRLALRRADLSREFIDSLGTDPWGQEEGTCWLSGSTFQGKAVMRASIVGWQTTAADIDRSAEAILAAARQTARF